MNEIFQVEAKGEDEDETRRKRETAMVSFGANASPFHVPMVAFSEFRDMVVVFLPNITV